MKMERFESADVWRRARELNRMIYAVSDTSRLSRDAELRGKLRNAALEMMERLAEAFEGGDGADRRKSLSRARAACGRIRSQCYVARDQQYISAVDFQDLSRRARDVSDRAAFWLGRLPPERGRLFGFVRPARAAA